MIEQELPKENQLDGFSFFLKGIQKTVETALEDIFSGDHHGARVKLETILENEKMVQIFGESQVLHDLRKEEHERFGGEPPERNVFRQSKDKDSSTQDDDPDDPPPMVA